MTTRSSTATMPSNSSTSAKIDPPPLCRCKLPAWRGVSRSERNPDRAYYKCVNADRGDKDSCKYWQWEDQIGTQNMPSQTAETPTNTPASSQKRQMWSRESSMKRKRADSPSETQESVTPVPSSRMTGLSSLPGSQTTALRPLYSLSQSSTESESPMKRFKPSMPASEKALWDEELNTFDEDPDERMIVTSSMGGVWPIREPPVAAQSTQKLYQAHAKEKSLENLRGPQHTLIEDSDNPFTKTSPIKPPETPLRSRSSLVLSTTPQTPDEKRKFESYSLVEGLQDSTTRIEQMVEGYERRLLAKTKSIESKDLSINNLKREKSELKGQLEEKDAECDELKQLVASLKKENSRLKLFVERA